uniref:Ani s 11-like protein n=1 Tax=Anisakis simplex TaxID=6269 RepID=E9RFF4_ANISI|nr:Ani s 11-like protein precursor [Anisakis simplex]
MHSTAILLLVLQLSCYFAASFILPGDHGLPVGGPGPVISVDGKNVWEDANGMSELHGPGPVVSGSGIGRVFPPRSGQLPIGGPGPVVSGSGIGGGANPPRFPVGGPGPIISGDGVNVWQKANSIPKLKGNANPPQLPVGGPGPVISVDGESVLQKEENSL